MAGAAPEYMRPGRKAVHAHTDTPAGSVCVARDSYSNEVVAVLLDGVRVPGEREQWYVDLAEAQSV